MVVMIMYINKICKIYENQKNDNWLPTV